jgi:hypothetical protein
MEHDASNEELTLTVCSLKRVRAFRSRRQRRIARRKRDGAPAASLRTYVSASRGPLFLQIYEVVPGEKLGMGETESGFSR